MYVYTDAYKCIYGQFYIVALCASFIFCSLVNSRDLHEN